MTKRYLRTIRDILDYAIEQEEEANRFYKHLAQDVEKEELRAVLEDFAIDEARHKLRLEGVRDGEMDYKELLAFAIKKEAKAEQLYTKLAQLTKREHIKELFTLLAQEEARHKFNLEFEYDLVSF